MHSLAHVSLISESWHAWRWNIKHEYIVKRLRRMKKLSLFFNEFNLRNYMCATSIFPYSYFFELQQCEHAPFLLQTHHVFCERCITNFFYRKWNYFFVLILDNCWIIMNMSSFYYDTIVTTMMLFTVLQIQFHYVKK